MPTYEYQCKKCKHTFEIMQSITAEPLKKCPKCAASVKRLIGAGAGVIFKGPGFYQTDYRSKSYNEGKKKDSPSSASCPATGTKSDCAGCPKTDN